MSKTPWLEVGSPWKTEPAFWTWVRGVLRKGWSKHPLKIEYIKRNRIRIPNPVKKNATRFPEVWGMTCEICKVPTVQSDIQIDHKGDSCRFAGLSDSAKYIEHLFLIDFSSIRSLCTKCHKIVSHAQNAGVSFKEAALQKRVIEFISQDKDIVLAYLSLREYSGAQVSNASKRRLLVETIMRGEADEQVD